MGRKANQPPLLQISHGELNEKQTFYNVVDNGCHTTSIPILCNKRVLGSTYGWLVLVDTNPNECCLWNPLSGDIIELPELAKPYMYSMCVLTKPPNEPDCHILFTTPPLVDRAFGHIGDHEFATQFFEPGTNLQPLTAIGSFQGKTYGIVKPKFFFVTIHFVGNTLELRPILKGGQPWRSPCISRPWVTWDPSYLIESPCDGGELLLVQRMLASSYIQGFCDFKVFRIDTNEMECVELENIGERTIFVSDNGDGFCCSSSIGTKPNCIYYMNGEGDCRNMYIYDLDDRGTTMMLPCPTVGRSQSVAFWVEHQALHKFINIS